MHAWNRTSMAVSQIEWDPSSTLQKQKSSHTSKFPHRQTHTLCARFYVVIKNGEEEGKKIAAAERAPPSCLSLLFCS